MIATLAVGIGATGAGVSVLRSVVQPLSYAPSDRVVMAAERDSAANDRLASYPTFQDWHAGTDAFEALAFARGSGTVMRTASGAERLVSAFVTEDFFRVLPEPPAVGRTLDAGDFAREAAPAVVLSYHIWKRKFGGDPAAVGRDLVLGDRSYTIVGAMPRDYIYPPWADLYAPIGAILSSDHALTQRGVHVDSRIVGRLRPGVDTATGRRALSAVAARLADAYPAESGGWRAVATYPVSLEIVGDTAAQLRLLAAAAALVLLIACVNVANLSLARSASRSHEMAIRRALGARRTALWRLVAVESLVLGVVAGALGIGVAAWLTGLVRLFGAEVLPRSDEVAVNEVAVAMAAVVALSLVVVLGVLPGVARSSETVVEDMKDGGGAGAGRFRQRWRSGLVVSELALALMLLAGAALLCRSLLRLQRVNTGLQVDHLLAVPIDPPAGRYDEPARALALYRRVAEAVAAVPGVRSVALTNHVPLSGASMTSRIIVDGVAEDSGAANQVLFREVDESYFLTAGIPVVAGRGFVRGDIDHPGDAVLVNQTLARRYWPGQDPLGRRVTVFKSAQGRPDFGEPIRASVVGVVGDVHHFAPDTEVVPEVYLPYTVTVWSWMSLLARVEPHATGAALAIGRAVTSVELDIPLEGANFRSGVYEVSESLADTMSYRRLLTGLLASFAVPALLLTAIGVYGVIAYLVTQREREIAVRMALGAGRWSVLRLVLGQGFRLAVVGVAIGALGALALTRLLNSQLYEVSPRDPVALIGASLLVGLFGLLATYLPALRATAVDPMRALRSE